MPKPKLTKAQSKRFDKKFGKILNEALCEKAHDGYKGGIHIHTLEGIHDVEDGDWIIKGIKGEFYPCKPDIFELTYKKVKGGRDG